MATLAIDQLTAAQAQAAAAATGVPDLESLEISKLPSVSLFQIGPSDTGGAYRYAAYWTAIAGRALHSRTLGITAGGYAVQAVSYVVSYSTEGMSQVLLDAAARIRQGMAGSTDPEAIRLATYAVSVLSQASTPSAIAKAKSEDDSVFGTLQKLMAQFQNTLKVVAIGVGVVTAATLTGVAWWLISRYRKR